MFLKRSLARIENSTAAPFEMCGEVFVESPDIDTSRLICSFHGFGHFMHGMGEFPFRAIEPVS